MAAEQKPKSEATVRLPETAAAATAHLAAQKADVIPLPPPPPSEANAAVGIAQPTTFVRPPLSRLEKAQRRLIKNLVMGGFFVAVLVALFYFLSR